jgi:hypothetical protein
MPSPLGQNAPSLFRVAAAAAVTIVMGARGTDAQAGDKIRVLDPTPLHEKSEVPKAVREECKQLGRLLPAALARANRDIVLVKSDKELAGKGKHLEVQILEVNALGGGVFSGPKFMTVRAVLFDGDKEVGDVEGKRGSTMSFSACGSLEKVEKVLGQDLAKWLENPKPHGRIADK